MWTQFEYAFAISPENNSWLIRELGNYQAEGTFSPGDVFKISIEAGPVVKYYKNGNLLRTSGVAPSNYPYVLGTTLFDIGATISNAKIQVP